MAAAGGKEKKDVDMGRIQILYTDMLREAQETAISSAVDGLRMLLRGEAGFYKDVAAHVKDTLDSSLAGTWHVIVGKNFGSFVSHEAGRIIYFKVGSVAVLAFKHG
eukprot:PLAT14610.1.p2 GENE.PLAT14610.1~~PLAT14610.1.p2  ORF type:complete len:106 (+),score=39.22 PLAT14610.1:56-373(+)